MPIYNMSNKLKPMKNKFIEEYTWILIINYIKLSVFNNFNKIVKFIAYIVS